MSLKSSNHKKLLALISRGIKYGLDNMKIMLEALDFDMGFSAIHVAGTNGKGSVSTKIAKALELSGYRAGLYTSPHLFKFNERIQINGRAVSDGQIDLYLEKILQKAAALKVKLTYFEAGTLLAFLIFAKEKVDFAVIETGLGGRLDATNVIFPVLSVITSIDFDHTDILGDSLERIAAEKAGIIKPGVPLVVGSGAAFQSILKRAALLKCPVAKVPKVEGFYDLENSAIAKEALLILKKNFPVAPEAIEGGIRKRPRCRFEKRGNIIFDVAHNPAAFTNLFKVVGSSEIETVFALNDKKDIEACVDIVGRNAKHVYLVHGRDEKLLPPQKLRTVFKERGFENTSIVSLKEILNTSRKILVCGSFYIMAEAFQAIEERERNAY